MMLHELLKEERFERASENLTVQHSGGEGNVLADLVSRTLWEQLHSICEVLGIRPVRARLAADELACVQREVDRFSRVFRVQARVRRGHDG